MKKIFLVIPSLKAGGAERVMAFIAENLSKEKFKPVLIVVGFEKDQVYPVNNVEVIFLNKQRVSKSVFPLMALIRREKPQVVMSSIGHLNTIIALIAFFFRKTKFVAREANVASVRKQFSEKRKNTIKINPKKSLFKFLDVIVCQSNDMYQDVLKEFPNLKSKMTIINNPVNDQFQLKKSSPKKEGIISFITVGALHKRKGHDRILRVLSKINYPYKYFILGSGKEKDNIFNLAESLGVAKNITHVPYTSEVSKYLSQSDFYLQGSYVEGFPNAVIESCAVGTPVIAFNAPGGINEIISPMINGYVAQTEEEFFTYLKAGLNNKYSPLEVRNVVLEKFGKEKIITAYEELFTNI